MSLRKSLLILVASLAAPLLLSAQKPSQTDSIVVLMNATSLEQYESRFGTQYRKAINARFLHNNTTLVCDTAIWNVDSKHIKADGHVQILQEETVLSSESLDYYIDDNLAKFRGDVVQLLDKQGNTLRTRYLDYNTKDSVAIFERGASMHDKDGQVIESYNGTYDSKEKLFTFERNVNMFTDTVYVKTSQLYFHTDYDFAEFFGDLNAWKDGNMISSDEGTYDKDNERFFFTGNVHIMTDTQEGWSDSLYYDRLGENVEMYGNIQVMDTTRNVSALADILTYVDTLSRVTLEKNASVVARTEENGVVDTVYMGASKFIYWTVPRCDINGNIIATAQKRLEDMAADPVSTYRKNAAEEAARAAAEADAQRDDPNKPKDNQPKSGQKASSDQSNNIQENAAAVDIDSLKIDADSLDGNSPQLPDSLAHLPDTLALSDTLALPEPIDPEQARLDSIAAAEQAVLDSIAAVEKFRLDSIATADSLLKAKELARLDSLAHRDTTAIGFLKALHGVKLYKSDMQASCDSLEYTDLDSLARLYISPIIWNEGNRQYTSDSISIAVKGQRMDKASLQSNAFIIIQEDSTCFDQIKGAEILAYFDSTTALSRFDALGGASALFYLMENDVFATVNKVESKMLSATFADGEIDRVYYFDSPKNDAYPVVQLPKEEREMKGFNWQPGLRPSGPLDITPLELRKSQRTTYLGRPMPTFKETDRFFPGYMKDIQKKLAAADSLRRARHAEERQRQLIAEEEARIQAEQAVADSIAAAEALADSLAVAAEAVKAAEDSLAAAADSLKAVADTLVASADTVATEVHVPTEAELKEMARAAKEAERQKKAAEAEAKRQARIDAREARWAELDARDAAKEAAKQAKALEKKRKRTLKAVIAAEKQAAKDQKKLDRYIEKYQKRQARKEQTEQIN